MKRSPIHTMIVILLFLAILFCFLSCKKSACEEEQEYSAAQEQEFFFYSDTGARGIRLFSEDIVAYGFEPLAPSEVAATKFGLIDVYEEFPPETESYKADEPRKYDWADYQHRLEKAHYKLKIHKELEAEVNEIVTRLLQVDYVIPQISISSFEPPIEWSNEEILRDFIKNNCTITYFEGEYTAKDTNGDSTQNPLWRIYQGRCFFDSYPPNKCELHEFYIWLVDFSGEELVIYDLKYVKEAGCGRTSPLANDNKSNQ